MKRKPPATEAQLDRGCLYAPKCVSCPYRKCIKELELPKRAEFADAWRIVIAHMAPARP